MYNQYMPILSSHSLEIISRSAEQTRRVGMRLGGLLRQGDVICLDGDLGSGKTTLVQGIAAGWGSLDPVTSPTFVLVNLYRRLGGGRLVHLDAYRLSSATEAQELDLDTLMVDAPMVVEWADRIEPALPAENCWVSLRWIDENQRDLVFSARGKRYENLLSAFREQVYGVP
jgi:tRNA threonylcarbamoyladenosine biosynthesis protein TsaE